MLLPPAHRLLVHPLARRGGVTIDTRPRRSNGSGTPAAAHPSAARCPQDAGTPLGGMGSGLARRVTLAAVRARNVVEPRLFAPGPGTDTSRRLRAQLYFKKGKRRDGPRRTLALPGARLKQQQPHRATTRWRDCTQTRAPGCQKPTRSLSPALPRTGTKPPPHHPATTHAAHARKDDRARVSRPHDACPPPRR